MPFNASAALVQDLAARNNEAGWRSVVTTAVLPTGWREGPLAAGKLIDRIQPEIVLHMGVSRLARRFEVETRAFNATRQAADSFARYPLGRTVRRGGPPFMDATLPTGLLVSKLKLAGVPAGESRDAGRYICNALLYESLFAAARSQRKSLIGFIHIPALSLDGTASFATSDAASEWARLQKGLCVIIYTMIRFVRNQRATPYARCQKWAKTRSL